VKSFDFLISGFDTRKLTNEKLIRNKTTALKENESKRSQKKVCPKVLKKKTSIKERRCFGF